MSRYVIVPTERKHLPLLANRLRAEDLAEIEASGLPPRRMLLRLWQNSNHCWTAFVDGEIALVGGCAGQLLESQGQAWLFTTAAIERVPMAFAKEARRWLREVLAEKTSVVTACLDSYEKSFRFWSMLGFRHTGFETMPTGAIFKKMAMERA